MATFVSNDPKTGADETRGKGVKRPKAETRRGVQIWMGEVNAFRRNLRVCVRPCLIKCSELDDVPDAGCQIR